MRPPRDECGPQAAGFQANYRLKMELVMKRKRPKLVVLDPKDFSEIALEKYVRSLT